MKRILCLILTLAMVLPMLFTGAAAEEVLSVSDEAIRILKLEEGFSATPYWDYAQWTVGYGTKCPDDKLEEYRQNGISEEEAEALLRTYIAKFESEIHGFMIRTGVQLNQNQFDALVSFVFNVGTANYKKSTLRKKVLANPNDPAIADQFERWVYAKGKVLLGLMKRRADECELYFGKVME